MANPGKAHHQGRSHPLLHWEPAGLVSGPAQAVPRAAIVVAMRDDVDYGTADRPRAVTRPPGRTPEINDWKWAY
jgi:hypothetical protein